MAKMQFTVKIVLAIVVLCLAKFGEPLAHKISQPDWTAYMMTHEKEYPTAAGVTDTTAKYYYAYNKNLVDNHNRNAELGKRTFTLRLNQFSDMRLIHFNALFPKTTPLVDSTAIADPPLVQPALPTFDLIQDGGMTLQPADQGTVCNSGWAYATARSVEILAAQQLGDMNPLLMSAQKLIDCAGSGIGCRNQVAQQAFDYLAVHGQDLKTEDVYQNQKKQSEQGMCLLDGIVGTNLAKYSILADGSDDEMKKYVSAGHGVVIEVNPTSFEFMHYGGGVFQPPRTSTSGSHYMVVIGYGYDAEKELNYWLVQNSFGRLWGEEGRIRIVRNGANSLVKNAIFATELA